MLKPKVCNIHTTHIYNTHSTHMHTAHIYNMHTAHIYNMHTAHIYNMHTHIHKGEFTHTCIWYILLKITSTPTQTQTIMVYEEIDLFC